ncbi:MAG: disulfide oxidoreductase, partial [Alphaproteobacteria bacterium]|nr:disulfide oxidoreductase [Alphaproteobacteria bacterium]
GEAPGPDLPNPMPDEPTTVPGDAPTDLPGMPPAMPAQLDAIGDSTTGIVEEGTDTSEAPAPEMETFYTFTWGKRPARQGGRPQGARRSDEAPRKAEGGQPRRGKSDGKPGGKPGGKPQGRRGPKPDDKPQSFAAKPARAEKKIDPDNPFAAALQGFKPS